MDLPTAAAGATRSRLPVLQRSPAPPRARENRSYTSGSSSSSATPPPSVVHTLRPTIVFFRFCSPQLVAITRSPSLAERHDVSASLSARYAKRDTLTSRPSMHVLRARASRWGFFSFVPNRELLSGPSVPKLESETIFRVRHTLIDKRSGHEWREK